MNKDKVEIETDEWLQMNFPVGSGPHIIAGYDCHVSQDHYMKIEFPKNMDSAFFIIRETPPEANGLRGKNDSTIVSFTISRELLLKIVRTIKVSNDIQYNDDIANW